MKAGTFVSNKYSEGSCIGIVRTDLGEGSVVLYPTSNPRCPRWYDDDKVFNVIPESQVPEATAILPRSKLE